MSILFYGRIFLGHTDRYRDALCGIVFDVAWKHISLRSDRPSNISNAWCLYVLIPRYLESRIVTCPLPDYLREFKDGGPDSVSTEVAIHLRHCHECQVILCGCGEEKNGQ